MTDERFGEAWRLERRDDGIRILWFDRPGSSQNSLDRGTLVTLGEAVAAVAADPKATLLAIQSAKPRGFCAGADLKQFRESSSFVEVKGYAHLGIETFDAIEKLKIPTVAVIHGVCLGGGLELALSCRDRVAIEGGDARFGCPEVNLSLIPGWDGIGRLTRLIGLPHALDLLLTGRTVEVEAANQLGLVDGIILAEKLDTELAHLANRPPNNSASDEAGFDGWEDVIGQARERVNTGPEANKRAREILLDVLEAELLRGRDAGREGAVIGLTTLAMSPEAREAIERFFQRPAKNG